MSSGNAPPPTQPPNSSSGCLTALLIAVGILLLLPGLCAIIIIGVDPKSALADPSTLTACLAFLAIGGGGVALIVFSIRQSLRARE
jgi:hypothetical protein